MTSRSRGGQHLKLKEPSRRHAPHSFFGILLLAAATLGSVALVVRFSQPRVAPIKAQVPPNAPLFNNTPYEVYSDTVVRKMVLEDLDNDDDVNNIFSNADI